MKMTRLEWRYLQKIALDHPYFDTHELPLTEKEAEAIVKANIRMTGKEFVDSIYTQLGMTRPSEEKKPFAWLRSIGEQFTIPPIRKIVISVLIVLLLTVFFAATPMGQAIAESVIQYIVTLLDGGELVVSQSGNKTSPYAIAYDGFAINDAQDLIEASTDYVSVSSFNEFTDATGKVPVMLPLPYTELYYEYDDDLDYLAFYSTYDTPSGKVVAYQIWDADDMESTTSTGYEVFQGDDSIYYSIEKEEGYIRCKKVFSDSVFSVSSKGYYTLDDIVKMLDNR